MSRFGWLLGRGSNPLDVPDRAPAEAAPPEPQRAAASSEHVRQQAISLGVSAETLAEMVDQREQFVAQVAADPRAWGFNLLASGAPRRSVVDEYRRATRLTGTLGESFLASHDALMAVVPEPPTMPDGTPLDEHLVRATRMSGDAARDIAHHVRTTIQATLGAPLDEAAVERAVREAAWDHELDAAQVTPLVLRALADVL